MGNYINVLSRYGYGIAYCLLQGPHDSFFTGHKYAYAGLILRLELLLCY